MPDNSELLRFVNELEGDITADVQPDASNPADFREVAFTKICADELEAAGIVESPSVCHWERGRGAASFKVSGYSVPDEDSRLDLFVTSYVPGPHGDVPTINGSEVDVLFNKVERFLGRAVDGLKDEVDPALPERYMAERISSLAGRFDRVNFFLFTNARLAVRREKERKLQVEGVPATYEVWDVERLRRLRESGAAYEALNVDLRGQHGGGLPCVRLSKEETGYRTCVAIFPGTLLRDLYDEYGSRLLELNVRSYLQAKGKINRGILETLRNDPADFMAYNNGITVVAEDILFGPLADGREGILELRGMQVVNGGQTTASIHRAAKEYEADLSNVYVQGKVVVVAPERFNEVVPSISRFANSQNKVTDPDLQANHRFHVGVERVSKREWTPDQTSKWFYERARGSYQTARSREGSTEPRRKEFDRKYPASQRFTKEDLAKFENAWRGLPYVVNRGGQKNFTQFMTFVKAEMGELAEGWEPTPEEFRRLIGKAILFRDVQKIVRGMEEITAYRINVTGYIVSLLAEKTARRLDLEAIWKRQAISKDVGETVRFWAPSVFQALLKYGQEKGVHMDNVLKGQGTWEYLLSLDLKVPNAVERELVSASQQVMASSGGRRATEGMSTEDENNAARCMALNAEQWMKIVAWGNSSGELKSWQMGIATTLASYAAQGWNRAPSQKQAKHGAAIIALGRAAGALHV